MDLAPFLPLNSGARARTFNLPYGETDARSENTGAAPNTRQATQPPWTAAEAKRSRSLVDAE